MKAVLVQSFGPPDELVVADIPVPRPGPGEVLVRVKAAALNFADTLLVRNRYQHKPDLPFSPCAEFAGIVETPGPGVTGWKVGDRVAAYIGWGAAREFVAVRAEQLVAIPRTLDFERAAGLCVTYGTAVHGLVDRAGLAPGETLAVLGAAGGAGLAAVEIGRALGARVVACASSQDKLDLAREHGAELTLNYARDGLKEGLRSLTDGRGVDVIYDPVGGDLAEPALRAMAWKGRYLVVGFAAGEIPKIPLNLLLLKGCDLKGVSWGGFVERDPAGHAATMARILDLAARGEIGARVDAVYPLEEAGAALARIARREARGKIVLRLDGEPDSGPA